MAEPLQLHPAPTTDDTKVSFVANEYGSALAKARATPALGKWALLAYEYGRELCASTTQWGTDGHLTAEMVDKIFNDLGCKGKRRNRRWEAIHQLVAARYWRPEGHGGMWDTRFCLVPSNRSENRAKAVRSKHAERNAKYRAKKAAEATVRATDDL